MKRSAFLAALGVVTVATGLWSPSNPARADSNEAPRATVAASAISAGFNHTCALLKGGVVKCWGAGANGRLGQGNEADLGDGPGEMGADLAAVDVGTGRTAIAVSAGDSHTCALLDNGTVKCWGSGGQGRLGLGTTDSRGDQPGEMGDALPAVQLGTGRTARAVTAGDFHTCALLDNGTVKCWGSGANGQLGLGDTTDRGDQPGEMGDALPAVQLGTGRTARAITAGSTHTCAVLDNGTVKCWGASAHGQLGRGNTDTIGDDAGEMGDDLPVVNLGSGRTATAISVGPNHSCALLDDATVKCWGAGADGRLGQGDPDDRGDEPGEMGENLRAVRLGTGRTALAVTTGGAHTCALLDNAKVKCWGSGSVGRLGLGDDDSRGDQSGEMGDNLPSVKLGKGRTAQAVTAGGGHTCALVDNATMRCWGLGLTGQLGQGAKANLGDGPNEMGGNLKAIPLARAIGRASVSVTLVAERSSVTAGDTIRYTVRVRNTGTMPLDDVKATALVSDCGRTITRVHPQATFTYTCTATTRNRDVPQTSNQVFVVTSHGAVDESARVRTRVDRL